MRRDGERLSPVVEKVRVALIREQEDVTLTAQFRDAAEFIIIKDGSWLGRSVCIDRITQS